MTKGSWAEGFRLNSGSSKVLHIDAGTQIDPHNAWEMMVVGTHRDGYERVQVLTNDEKNNSDVFIVLEREHVYVGYANHSRKNKFQALVFNVQEFIDLWLEDFPELQSQELHNRSLEVLNYLMKADSQDFRCYNYTDIEKLKARIGWVEPSYGKASRLGKEELNVSVDTLPTPRQETVVFMDTRMTALEFLEYLESSNYEQIDFAGILFKVDGHRVKIIVSEKVIHDINWDSKRYLVYEYSIRDFYNLWMSDNSKTTVNRVYHLLNGAGNMVDDKVEAMKLAGWRTDYPQYNGRNEREVVIEQKAAKKTLAIQEYDNLYLSADEFSKSVRNAFLDFADRLEKLQIRIYNNRINYHCYIVFNQGGKISLVVPKHGDFKGTSIAVEMDASEFNNIWNSLESPYAVTRLTTIANILLKGRTEELADNQASMEFVKWYDPDLSKATAY